MISRETEAAYYRPAVRKLRDLTNEELQQLFELRARKVQLDPKGLWDDNRIVYADTMRRLLAAVYEVMLEIQSRYPKCDICKYGDRDDGSYPIEMCLLPIHFKLQNEQGIDIGAPKPEHLECGLKQLKIARVQHIK